MKFRSESTIAHPRTEVFAAYRDQLSSTVPFIEDIREIQVVSRTEEGVVVRLHNRWVSDRDIPKAASAVIKPEHLAWDDFAAWNEETMRCEFELKTAFGDAVQIRGTNALVEDPAGTRVILEGEFLVDAKRIPGVPSFLAKRLLPQVEKFIVALIQPNLEKTNVAVGRFLDSQS